LVVTSITKFPIPPVEVYVLITVNRPSRKGTFDPSVAVQNFKFSFKDEG